MITIAEYAVSKNFLKNFLTVYVEETKKHRHKTTQGSTFQTRGWSSSQLQPKTKTKQHIKEKTSEEFLYKLPPLELEPDYLPSSRKFFIDLSKQINKQAKKEKTIKITWNMQSDQKPKSTSIPELQSL